MTDIRSGKLGKDLKPAKDAAPEKKKEKKLKVKKDK